MRPSVHGRSLSYLSSGHDPFPEKYLTNLLLNLQALRSGQNELSGIALTLRLGWLENVSLRNPPPFGLVSKAAVELLEQQEEIRFLYQELKEYLGSDLERVTGCKVRTVRTAKLRFWSAATPFRQNGQSTNHVQDKGASSITVF